MSLFADLYGYWEPPAGWQRTESSGTRVVFEHAEHGRLSLERPPGCDDMPINVLWVPGAERKVTATELAKSFLADGHQITRFRVNVPVASEVTWVMRPQSFGQWLLGVLGR